MRTPTEPASRTDHRHVRVEGVDWSEVFDVLTLLRSFRMAIQPAKLLLAFMLAVVLYLGGLGMDVMWGPRVIPGEVQRYVAFDEADYKAWLDEAGAATARSERGLIFETLVHEQVSAFGRLIDSGMQLRLGLGALLSGRALEGEGVLGAAAWMIVVVPGWLLAAHPGFLALYLAFAFMMTAALGGGIARLAALDAVLGIRGNAFDGLGYALRRYHWLILGPIIPAAAVFGLGLLLSAAGAVFFNAPGLDVVGGLLFGLMLAVGVVASLVLVGLVVAMPLMPAAVAVEGADAFDVVSRCYNYAVGRPLRWLVYHIILLIYGALTYLLVLTLVVLALWFTREFAGWWSLGQEPGDPGRLARMMPQPPDNGPSRFTHPVAWSQLDPSGQAAAALIGVWVRLLLLMLPAYAVSYFFCAQCWVYLLLRRAADGTELSEMGPAAEPIRVGGIDLTSPTPTSIPLPVRDESAPPGPTCGP